MPTVGRIHLYPLDNLYIALHDFMIVTVPFVVEDGLVHLYCIVTLSCVSSKTSIMLMPLLPM